MDRLIRGGRGGVIAKGEPSPWGLRGQVSAPIELVVAVIILVMSMTLAFYIIEQTNNTKCIAELRSSNQHLQQAMQDIALGSAGTKKTVAFEMPACGNQKITAVRFVYYDNPAYCNACPSNYGGCWQIVPVSEENGQFVALGEAATCVDMPGRRIQLQQKVSAGCEALSENPCPPSGGSVNPSCPFDQSGVTQAAWNPSDPANSPSRWRTLGKTASKYFIELEKGVSQLGGLEVGTIQICAKKA